MCTALELLQEKDEPIHAVGPEASVVDATQVMNAAGVGAVMVRRGDRLVGILTERDVLRRVVAEGLNPADTPVKDVMTQRVISCSAEARLEQVQQLMDVWGVRHVPVDDVDHGLCGMISMRDLNNWKIQEDGVEIAFLKQYVFGRA